jgi:hypothetical protein
MRTLAALSGWPWPDYANTQEFLDRLAGLSGTWDFRGSKERNFIPGTPAEVGGRVIPDDLVRAAADALGLVSSDPLSGRSFSHLVVLSGLLRACVNRTHYAAGLVRGNSQLGSVTVLGAHRILGGTEPGQALELGLGELADEADVIVAATRRAFGLTDAATTVALGPQGSPLEEELAPGPEQRLHAAWAHYRWPAADVVIAPSGEPAQRRANTADQLRFWADLAGIGSQHEVLLVTTQIYVPYQHMDALRVLGLERGCGVYSCGVDAESSLLPAKAFGGREYLQEIRSALRAAAALLKTARDTATGTAQSARRLS